jgi:hypothetical protein
MSTGRKSCPPDWAVALTDLIGTLQGGCTALPLQPLCDAAGVTVGYAAAVYNCATNQVTVLRFNAELQPVTTLVTGLAPCGLGGAVAVQHFQTSDLVCLDVGGGVIREARQVITRDATGAIVATRLEDPATGATLAGAIVECPC